MSKLRELWEIEAGQRCPHCHKNHINKEMDSRMGYYQCADCHTKFINFGYSWLDMLANIIVLIAAERIYTMILQPNGVKVWLMVIILLVVALIVKESFLYLVYVLFGKTRTKIYKD